MGIAVRIIKERHPLPVVPVASSPNAKGWATRGCLTRALRLLVLCCGGLGAFFISVAANQAEFLQLVAQRVAADIE